MSTTAIVAHKTDPIGLGLSFNVFIAICCVVGIIILAVIAVIIWFCCCNKIKLTKREERLGMTESMVEEGITASMVEDELERQQTQEKQLQETDRKEKEKERRESKERREDEFRLMKMMAGHSPVQHTTTPQQPAVTHSTIVRAVKETVREELKAKSNDKPVLVPKKRAKHKMVIPSALADIKPKYAKK